MENLSNNNEFLDLEDCVRFFEDSGYSAIDLEDEDPNNSEENPIIEVVTPKEDSVEESAKKEDEYLIIL